MSQSDALIHMIDQKNNGSSRNRFQFVVPICRPDKMVHIGIGIAVGTAVLMTCCVLIFWCNTEAIPALAKCPYVTYRLYINIRSQFKITHIYRRLKRRSHTPN